MNQENSNAVNCDLTKMPWESSTLNNFRTVLEDIPAPIRGIAETRVSKKAECLVTEDGRDLITEKDIVAAFFAETPGGFIGPMTLSLEGLNIDYKKYGFK